GRRSRSGGPLRWSGPRRRHLRVSANREQWPVPAGSGSSHGKVSMSRTPGEVLKRALAAVAGVLVALTAIAALAHPAGAADGGSDVLAETATRTLADLRGARVAQVAAALAGGSMSPTTAVASYQADLGQLAAALAARSGTPA